MRRIIALFALFVLGMTTAVACTPAPKPTVSFSYSNLEFPGTTAGSGALAGDTVPIAFRTKHAPAGSRLLLQRSRDGGATWQTINTLVVGDAGSAFTEAVFGRSFYRLALVDARGAMVASSTHSLNGYRKLTFGQLFDIPLKHKDGFRSFDYFFRDILPVDNTSCNQISLVVNNESATPQTLQLTLPGLNGGPPRTDSNTVDRAAGPSSIGVFVTPGQDFAIRALGTDLFVGGSAYCYTPSGRL